MTLRTFQILLLWYVTPAALWACIGLALYALVRL